MQLRRAVIARTTRYKFTVTYSIISKDYGCPFETGDRKPLNPRMLRLLQGGCAYFREAALANQRVQARSLLQL